MYAEASLISFNIHPIYKGIWCIYYKKISRFKSISIMRKSWCIQFFPTNTNFSEPFNYYFVIFKNLIYRIYIYIYIYFIMYFLFCYKNHLDILYFIFWSIIKFLLKMIENIENIFKIKSNTIFWSQILYTYKWNTLAVGRLSHHSGQKIKLCVG